MRELFNEDSVVPPEYRVSTLVTDFSMNNEEPKATKKCIHWGGKGAGKGLMHALVDAS